MSLTLTVDGARWREHLSKTAAANPGIVPVAKGNGYGFTLSRLARKAQWLADRTLADRAPGAGEPALDTIAAGTYREVAELASRFHGSVLVLTPWRPFGAALDLDPRLAARVIHTVSRPEDLIALLERQPDASFVLEQVTSMLRHGMSPRELRHAADLLTGRARRGLRGVAVHLPLGHAPSSRGSHLAEMHQLMNEVVASGLETSTVWVSHLNSEEQGRLRAAYPDFTFRARIGTDLWLGDRGALQVTSTVLDVHPVQRGDVFGYRARTAPRQGHILVVSGGTAHGIGLAAPTGESSVRARASALARGGLDAAGSVRSPFFIDGKQRLFAEPPHMQASMVFLPSGVDVPSVGEQIEVRVRFTTTRFDRIELV